MFSKGKRQGDWDWLAFCLPLLACRWLSPPFFLTPTFNPILAANAPALLDPAGPLLTLPGLLAQAVPGVVFALGMILLAVAMLRTRVLPRGGAILVIIGALMINLPPPPIGPVPWLIISIGGLVFGAGSAWLGYAVWSETS